MVAHNLVSKLAAIVGRCDLLNDSTKEQRRAPRSKWGEFSVEQSGAFLVVICSICGRRVNLETSKTDEDGQAVHEALRGHVKSGQRWSLQNRPTESGLGLGCFTPPPPEEASLFSCANSVDRI